MLVSPLTMKGKPFEGFGIPRPSYQFRFCKYCRPDLVKVSITAYDAEQLNSAVDSFTSLT
jgi:hypothetical protein